MLSENLRYIGDWLGKFCSNSLTASSKSLFAGGCLMMFFWCQIPDCCFYV